MSSRTPPDWLLSLLAEKAEIRQLGGGVGSLLPATAASGSYDRFAALYDAVVSNRTYNGLFWGLGPEAHREFAAKAYTAGGPGTILDCPCGSLLFTALHHPLEQGRQVVLVDRSEAMLRRGLRRLTRKGPVNRAYLLQGDLFDLPLRRGVLSVVASFGGLHLFAERARMIDIFWSLLPPGGQLFLSSLIGGERSTGDWLLARLHRAGQIAPPINRFELRGLLPEEANMEIRGSWAFVTAEKTGDAIHEVSSAL